MTPASWERIDEIYHSALARSPEERPACLDEACREVLQHADAFRYDGEEKFRAWLFKTALNKILERNRDHGAQRRDGHREIALATGGDAPDLRTPGDSASQGPWRASSQSAWSRPSTCCPRTTAR